MKEVVLGIDVGGTKIAVGAVDRQGHLAWSRRIPSRADGGGPALLDRLTSLLGEAIESVDDMHDIRAIGVASPGQIDYAGGRVVFATDNLPGWTGTEVAPHVQRAHGLPTWLDNDGNLAALGEARYGAGKDHDVVVCVSVGTGIGGGIVHEGRVVRGASGSAGGFGHLSLDPRGGVPCYCGNRGCVEGLASGKAIADHARRRLREGAASSLRGRPLDGAADVVQAARDGDAMAKEVLDEAAEHLALALVQIVNLFNPSCVVLSGGVSDAGGMLLDPIREIVTRRSLPGARDVLHIVPGALGGFAGVLGAAAMAWDGADAGQRVPGDVSAPREGVRT